MRRRASRLFLNGLALLAFGNSNSALACAVCFGNSESALAKGLVWGVFALLAVVVCVLGSVAAFFVFLARRAAAMPDASQAESPTFTKDLT